MFFCSYWSVFYLFITLLNPQTLVKSFIKREDIQDAIEAAVANPVDYNFSVSLDGNIYRGRNTKPEDVKEEDNEKLQRAVLQ